MTGPAAPLLLGIDVGGTFTDVIVRHAVQDQAKVLGSLARLKEVRAAVADV